MEPAALLREAIAASAIQSPRVKRLRAILDKLEPPAPRPGALPAAQARRRAELVAVTQEGATALAGQ